MPDANVPITTATGKIKIEIDRSEYDSFKRAIEQDFADWKDKLAAVFKVSLDEFKAQLQEIQVGADRQTKQTETAPPQGPPPAVQNPDQMLAKLTIIETNTENTVKAIEDLTDVVSGNTT